MILYVERWPYNCFPIPQQGLNLKQEETDDEKENEEEEDKGEKKTEDENSEKEENDNDDDEDSIEEEQQSQKERKPIRRWDSEPNCIFSVQNTFLPFKNHDQ